MARYAPPIQLGSKKDDQGISPLYVICSVIEPAIIHYIDIHLEMYYNYTPQNIIDKLVQSGIKQPDFCLNESETERFLF